MKPTLEACQLMHDGAIALAKVEANGMRIDTDYLDRSIIRCDDRIRELKEEIKLDSIYQTWKKRYGEKANLAARAQLAHVLFDVLEYPCYRHTKSKASCYKCRGTGKQNGNICKQCQGTKEVNRPGCAESDLENVDLPFVQKYLSIAKLEKMQSTYLKGIRGHVTDGLLHPVFNLHFVTSYRSSADSPNFQNIPIRDPKIGKIIRQAFVPRDGHILVEIDYSSAEVRGAACYGKDPNMLSYIEEKRDMHFDLADECYMLDGKVSKAARATAKNKFVFPALYGNYHVQMAGDLWSDLQKYDLKNSDDESIKQTLANKGITELGGPESEGDQYYINHIKQVENRFWNERFPVHNEWREEWWRGYLSRGWYQMLTGFVVQGVYKRTKVFNYCIQGVCFHWLLWSLIQLVNEIEKRKMKSKVIGQIHDSTVADVPENEAQDYIALATDIMTRRLKEHWKWIITPIEIEVETASDNWWNKKEYVR